MAVAWAAEFDAKGFEHDTGKKTLAAFRRFQWRRVSLRPALNFRPRRVISFAGQANTAGHSCHTRSICRTARTGFPASRRSMRATWVPDQSKPLSDTVRFPIGSSKGAPHRAPFLVSGSTRQHKQQRNTSSGRSSVGRVPHPDCGGRRFESFCPDQMDRQADGWRRQRF